ncbi:NAD-dependent protein deacetylase sirtuin-7 [Merluccius polli]|uniref:NAD-dependent protein deacetylase sirtuin-7 n=1 Tax=Merluccius polli TaxID=89951 RepID=A0AA47PA79_MERPO|nr:NAD-dependent protein deacetylase sirtuin-7 [Merluccius polli]
MEVDTAAAAAAGVPSRAERKALEKAKIVQRENERNAFKMRGPGKGVSSVKAVTGNEWFRQVARIMKKAEGARTAEESRALLRHRDAVEELRRRQVRSAVLKRKQEEVCDDSEVLRTKVAQLAEAVKQAQHLVVYTGAGISTAASIPDYRGPNGVWTQLQKGQAVCSSDLGKAEPTVTHMCIKMLHKENLVKHVVSQNCDGLHLRSGLPRHALSELHGNMFIEVCTSCTPAREYVRMFDVTERTSLHRHGTGRRCSHCAGDLRDTIVHFGERGTLEQPLNWRGASEAAERADVILCLGSSLKVLKKYACLWCMNRPAKRRPKLYIVNLQWTPKDDLATLKINGKCDDVMNLLMEDLDIQVPLYNKAEDPIFSLATPLRLEEEHSHSRSLIAPPAGQEDCSPDTQGLATDEPVQGGWFGRGYSKGRKKKKAP